MFNDGNTNRGRGGFFVQRTYLPFSIQLFEHFSIFLLRLYGKLCKMHHLPSIIISDFAQFRSNSVKLLPKKTISSWFSCFENNGKGRKRKIILFDFHEIAYPRLGKKISSVLARFHSWFFVFHWFHFDFGGLGFISDVRWFILRPSTLGLFGVIFQIRARGERIKTILIDFCKFSAEFWKIRKSNFQFWKEVLRMFIDTKNCNREHGAMQKVVVYRRDSKNAKVRESCRSQKHLQNEALVTKIGFDSTQNGPFKKSLGNQQPTPNHPGVKKYMSTSCGSASRSRPQGAAAQPRSPQSRRWTPGRPGGSGLAESGQTLQGAFSAAAAAAVDRIIFKNWRYRRGSRLCRSQILQVNMRWN